MTVSLLIETGVGHVSEKSQTVLVTYFECIPSTRPDTIVICMSRCLMERGDVSSSTNVKKGNTEKKDVRLN